MQCKQQHLRRTLFAQQRRRDRHVDRVGDIELDEYNAELQRMAERDARVAERAATKGR